MPQSFARDRSLPLTGLRFLTSFGAGNEKDARGALARTGVSHAAERQLSSLSGGEMARVALARALLRRPELLVLDEPLAGVDIAGEAALYELIAGMRTELGAAILLVSHDLHVVMAAADHVVCLNRHICCEGDAAAVVRDPAFIALFGPAWPIRSRSTPIAMITRTVPQARLSTPAPMITTIMITAIMGIIMMDELFWRAVAGAAMLGAVAGPIGCFVLWRRMAYLGASIAEMALLGAALGLLLRVDPLWGVLATSLTAALLLARPWSTSLATRSSLIPADTSIGLIGHAGLALGFIALSSLETVRADLLGYLFGDVLALSANDLMLIGVLGAAALAVLAMIWRRCSPTPSQSRDPAAEAGRRRGAGAQAFSGPRGRAHRIRAESGGGAAHRRPDHHPAGRRPALRANPRSHGDPGGADRRGCGTLRTLHRLCL